MSCQFLSLSVCVSAVTLHAYEAFVLNWNDLSGKLARGACFCCTNHRLMAEAVNMYVSASILWWVFVCPSPSMMLVFCITLMFSSSYSSPCFSRLLVKVWLAEKHKYGMKTKTPAKNLVLTHKNTALLSMRGILSFIKT